MSHAEIEPAALTAAPVCAMLAWWQRKAADRAGLPRRSDLDPLALGPRVLPHLLLADVRWQTDRVPRFRHRLVGTHITESLRRDYSGLDFEDCGYGDSWQRIVDAYTRCACERRPVASRGRSQWVEPDFLEYEIVRLPLLGEDGRVAMIVAAVSFEAV